MNWDQLQVGDRLHLHLSDTNVCPLILTAQCEKGREWFHQRCDCGKLPCKQTDGLIDVRKALATKSVSVWRNGQCLLKASQTMNKRGKQ